MRPGQAAPEFSDLGVIDEAGLLDASMRPGQAAPEFEASMPTVPSSCKRFNEAGAGCPGIPPHREFVRLTLVLLQ